MLQRLIATLLGVLGLAAIVLGVASATVWRGDDTLTATARAADGTTLLTTAPGVLRMGDPPVTIRATADDGTKVVLAVGRDVDVDAWVGTDAHTVVTGLQDWHTLTTEDVAASAAPGGEVEAPAEQPPADGAPADAAPEGEAPAEEAPAETPAETTPAETTPAPDPDGSDLWIEQVTGEGAAEMVWTPQEGRWTLLVATAGEGAGPPTVELSWPREVTTPWLVPGVVGGAVLLLLALVLAIRSRRGRRAGQQQDTTGGTPAADPQPHVGGSTRMDPDATATTDGQDH